MIRKRSSVITQLTKLIELIYWTGVEILEFRQSLNFNFTQIHQNHQNAFTALNQFHVKSE